MAENGEARLLMIPFHVSGLPAAGLSTIEPPRCHTQPAAACNATKADSAQTMTRPSLTHNLIFYNLTLTTTQSKKTIGPLPEKVPFR